MSKYLGLIKVSADEASRIIRDGARSRRDFFELVVRESGGTVEGYWLTNVGDWNIVCVVDMVDETPIGGAVAALQRRVAGLTDAERWIELAGVDDVAEWASRANSTDSHK
jgi:hypothetical protein